MSSFSQAPNLMRLTNATRRIGFTVVELLIVISIMTLLAAMALTVIYGAHQKAKVSRTKSQIARINEYLQYRWDEYDVRILPYRVTTTDRETLRGVRADAILELIRAEMPHDFDYVGTTGGQFPSTEFISYYNSLGAPWDTIDDQLAMRRPSVYRRYTATAPASWTDTNEQAECLYMILRSIMILDQSGVEHLHNDEVGDTDNDGMLEVLDAFGEPMEFSIRYDFDNDGEFEANEIVDFDQLATNGLYGGVIDLARLKFIVRSARLGDKDDAL